MENFFRDLFQRPSNPSTSQNSSANNSNSGNSQDNGSTAAAASNDAAPPSSGAGTPAIPVPIFVFTTPDFIMASFFGPMGIPLAPDILSSAMAASMMQEQPNAGPPPTSARALKQLPIIKVTTHDLIEPVNRECCICLTENELHSKVLRLPCAHILHPDCARQWLKQHNTCPVCRYELPTDCPQYEQGRIERMRNRKPRFARHELDRLSIRELKELLKRNGEPARDYHPVDKNDLIEYLIQSNVIDLIPSPPPVEYCYTDLKKMKVSQLKEVMNDAGVFFSKEDVVEKDDLLRLFVMSGRLTVLSEEELSQRQDPRKEDATQRTCGDHLVETVDEDSVGESDCKQDERIDTSILMEEDESCRSSGTPGMDSIVLRNTNDNEEGNKAMEVDEADMADAFVIARGIIGQESNELLPDPGRHDVSPGACEGESRADSDSPISDSSICAQTPRSVSSENDSSSSRKRQRRIESSLDTTSEDQEAEPAGQALGATGKHDSSERDFLSEDTSMDDLESEIVRRFQALTINQLQVLARECMVDTSNCLEKAEIIDRLVASDKTRTVTNTFEEWGCGEMRALASLVDVDLSSSTCRQEMIQTLHQEVSRRPHAGRYLLALAPLARLTTQQLRAVARDWLVNVSDCLERGEIIHRLVYAAQNRRP